MGPGRPPKCPHCGGTESVSKGIRRTKILGFRRLRKCKSCGRKFTPRNQKPWTPGDGQNAGSVEPGEAA